MKMIIYEGKWPGCFTANTDLLSCRLMLMMRLLIYLCENCAEKKIHKKWKDRREKEQAEKKTQSKGKESLGAVIDFSVC